MSAPGRWDIRAAQPADEGELRALAQILAQRTAPVGEVMRFAGRPVYVKGSRLAGSGARRHGLRRWLFGRPAPRAAEFENLKWLGRHGFRVPAPVGAGILWKGLLPRYQWLATRFLEDARPLAEGLAGTRAEREPLLEGLAVEVARMHALGFLHHDLFLRNLLVVPSAEGRQIAFLDAWAGGPGRGLRGPAYDLACLFFDVHGSLSTADLAAFFGHYLAQRGAGQTVPDPERLARAVDRDLRRLRHKLGAATSSWRVLDLLEALP